MRANCSAVRIVVCISCGLMIQSCDTALYHDLDEQQANRMVLALTERGIPAAKTKEGRGGESWTVEVPESRAEAALRILDAMDLPRSKPKGIDELYSQKSLIPTPQEELVRYQAALSGEIEQTLESLDHVVDARVHLVLAGYNPGTGNGEIQAVKASVLVRYQAGGKDDSPLDERSIADLVSGAVDGLSPNSVSVVLRQVVNPVDSAGMRIVEDGISPVLERYLLLGLSIVVMVLAAMLIQSRMALRRERSAK